MEWFFKWYFVLIINIFTLLCFLAKQYSHSAFHNIIFHLPPPLSMKWQIPLSRGCGSPSPSAFVFEFPIHIKYSMWIDSTRGCEAALNLRHFLPIQMYLKSVGSKRSLYSLQVRGQAVTGEIVHGWKQFRAGEHIKVISIKIFNYILLSCCLMMPLHWDLLRSKWLHLFTWVT